MGLLLHATPLKTNYTPHVPPLLLLQCPFPDRPSCLTLNRKDSLGTGIVAGESEECGEFNPLSFSIFLTGYVWRV